MRRCDVIAGACSSQRGPLATCSHRAKGVQSGRQIQLASPSRPSRVRVRARGTGESGSKFIDIGALFDVHGGRYGPDCAVLFAFSPEEATQLRRGLLEMGCDESIMPVYDVASMLPLDEGATVAAKRAVLNARVGQLVMQLATASGLPQQAVGGAAREGPGPADDLLGSSSSSALKVMLISGLSAEEIQEVAALLADTFPAPCGRYSSVVLASLVPNNVETRVEDFLIELTNDYWENVASMLRPSGRD